MAVTFKQATRQAAYLRIGVQGPSGAGKTLGALALAAGLAEGERFAVIDTENGSASLYADRYGFDVLEVTAPYLTSKYQEAVEAAVTLKYPVIVIDSISHQWDGNGGILQRKEETDARGGNHFSNWAPFTKEHNKFRSLILEAPIHLVATMRSKMAYAQEGEGRQTKIKKLGLQPIQRDGMEYEFTVAFDVQMDHRATASKDRTSLFTEGVHDLTDKTTAAKLLEWLGTMPKVAPTPISDHAKPEDMAEHLTEVPKPLQIEDRILPGERVEASAIKKESVRSAVAKVGVKGADWPEFFKDATGREYEGKIYEDDIAPLLEAVMRKRAGTPTPSTAVSSRGADAGTKDEATTGLKVAPSSTAS